MEREVLFQPKSSWQKDNCLFCSNAATLEAVCKVSENRGAVIRFCVKEECQKKAEEVARFGAKKMANKS